MVEVFIRANSGGTRLNKSDLLFSLLVNSWDEADERVGELRADLNAKEFDFTRDFILKTCLSLLNKGSRYEVEKFRQPGVRQEIEDNWKQISDAIRDVRDYLYSQANIQGDEAIPSYLVLIPLIYFRYHFSQQWPATGMRTYLTRTLLAGTFSGLPDQLIDSLVARLKEDKGFHLDHLFEVMRNRGRPLDLTPDRLLSNGYGSPGIRLLFSLWYDAVDFSPAYTGNSPQVDHIFPQSLLKKRKVKPADRNQLANCMLLEAKKNGPGDKGDNPPAEWLKDKSAEFLAKHLIPPDPNLWELDNFEAFIAARKELILSKFAGLLSRPGAG